MSGYELRQYQIPLNYHTSEEDLPETTALVSSDSTSGYPTNVPIPTTPSQSEYVLRRPASLRSLRETQVPLAYLGHARNVRTQTDFEPTKHFICNGTQTEFVVDPGVLEKLHTSVDKLKSEIVTLVAKQERQEQTSTNNIKDQLNSIKSCLDKIYAAKARFSDKITDVQTSTNNQLNSIKSCLDKIYAAKVRFSDKTTENSRQVYYKPSSSVTCYTLSPIYLMCLVILIFQAIILGVIFNKL